MLVSTTPILRATASLVPGSSRQSIIDLCRRYGGYEDYNTLGWARREYSLSGRLWTILNQRSFSYRVTQEKSANSELAKKEPSKKVTEWILERDEGLFSVSALTFGKIKKGIEKIKEHFYAQF